MEKYPAEPTHLASSLTITRPPFTVRASSPPSTPKILERYPVAGTISANAGCAISSFTRASITDSNRCRSGD